MNGKSVIIGASAFLAAMAIWAAAGRTLAANAVYPAENAFFRFTRTFARHVRAFGSRATLAAENDRLKSENAALGTLQTEVDALTAENARLRKELGFAKRDPGSWLPAHVLSHGGTAGAGKILRLGKGSRDGVKKNAAVVVADGLVGRVESVETATCTVRLVIDPKSRVACEIETGDDAFGATFGILYGGGARILSNESEGTLVYAVNPFLVRHLKRDYALPPRARILTSGRGGVFPRGIFVGWLIEQAHKDETQLEREGEVVSAVDFTNLEDVFIRRES